MVTLTRNFDIVHSGFTTSITAEFLSVSYIAKARYVRTLCRLPICHLQSFHRSLAFQTAGSPSCYGSAYAFVFPNLSVMDTAAS